MRKAASVPMIVMKKDAECCVIEDRQFQDPVGDSGLKMYGGLKIIN
jgi:hypothetical protein